MFKRGNIQYCEHGKGRRERWSSPAPQLPPHIKANFDAALQ